MQIFIHKNGGQVGPFTLPKVEEMLQNGELTFNDHAIKQGENQWTQLGSLFFNSRNNPNDSLRESLQLGNVPVNLAAADWAGSFFQKDIKAVQSTMNILATIGIGLFAIFPLGAILIGILGLIINGAKNAGTSFILILLGGFVGFFVLIIGLLLRKINSDRVAVLSKEFLIAKSGKKFYWKNLCQIHYSFFGDWVVARRSSGSTRIMTNTSWYYTLLPKNEVNSKQSSNMIELFFTDGRASIHPLMFDDSLIREIIKQIPAIKYLKTKKTVNYSK